MIVQKLEKAGLIHPPKWMTSGAIQYLTIMGSDAYGVSSGGSDVDIYGFCIPPKHLTFPHLAGEIPGFGRQTQRFEQWQEAHVKNPDGKDVEYDFSIFGIVKYFSLCMQNNPNLIDSLFTPRRCVLHSTAIGEHVRENRKLFLHKGAWHKFKGYAYSNFHKYKASHRETLKPIFEFQKSNNIQNMNIINSIRRELFCRGLSHGIQNPKFDGYDVRFAATGLEHLSDNDLLAYATMVSDLPKRDIDNLSNGFDTKAMYHVVRLLAEIEQIMIEHDLDLERNREQLKSIRRGEWTLEQIESHFTDKERALEAVYASSTLPHSPDEAVIKNILLQALEMHYGDISTAVARNPSMDAMLNDLKAVIARYDSNG